MKKFIAITLISAATMATAATTASASDLYVQGYQGWAQTAMTTGDK